MGRAALGSAARDKTISCRLTTAQKEEFERRFGPASNALYTLVLKALAEPEETK